MKRVILRVVAMLLTFALGVTFSWLILREEVNDTPPPCKVEVVSPEALVQRIESIASITPIAPVATVPAPAATPKPHFILDYDPEMFNPYGMYELMDPKPKEFAKVEGINLGVFGSGISDEAYIAVTTRNEYENYFDAPATFALVTERRVIFATSDAPGSGVEYRFEGEFLRTDFNAVAGTNKAVLRGVLTRMQNGKTIAEREVTFRFEHLGC